MKIYKKKYKKELTKENINQVLKQNFTWKINQVPPKYSAIKIDWKRAYSLARAWKDVNMKSREIEIFNIEIIDFSYPKLELKAEVQAWTYIRSIASDLWNILGIGWYITKLRRTKVWDLDVSLWKELDNFEENDFLDIKKLFSDKRFISLDSDILEKINNWLKVKWDFDFEIWEDLFVLKEDNITNIISYDWAYLRPLRKI
jgi:tRNA pseudouridine55 synthase